MVLPPFPDQLTQKVDSSTHLNSNILHFYICLFFSTSTCSPSILSLFSISILPLYSLKGMDNYGGDHSCCYFHPKEVVVGICALCLKERLLSLAAKQGHLPPPKDTRRSFRVLRRKPNIILPKVFALGSFLHRIESRRPRPDDDSDEGSIASLEGTSLSQFSHYQ